MPALRLDEKLFEYRHFLLENQFKHRETALIIVGVLGESLIPMHRFIIVICAAVYLIKRCALESSMFILRKCLLDDTRNDDHRFK